MNKVEVLQEKLDNIQGGLQLLFLAINAGDPHEELILRTKDLLKECHHIYVKGQDNA